MKNQNYSFFLFCELFNHYKPYRPPLNYDDKFERLEREYRQFLNSEHNDPKLPEYECMESFMLFLKKAYAPIPKG